MLSFDSFNALIHYWSQPYGLKAEGHASDYEFTFIYACADSVVLRGKKYNNRMCLYPLKQDPQTYISQVAAVRQSLSGIPRNRILVDGQTMTINCSDNHLKYSEGGREVDMPFIYTADGIRFYQMLNIKGVTVTEMSFDTASKELRSRDQRLVIPAPSLIERFVATNEQWYFNYSVASGTSDMCDDMKNVVADVLKGFKTNAWGYEALQSFYIGANLLSAEKDAHRMVVGWTIRDNYGTGNLDHFGYAVNMGLGESESLITITPVEAAVGFGTRTFCKPLVDFIGGNSPYQVVFDNQENPTSVTLTSAKDSSKWFTLKK